MIPCTAQPCCGWLKWRPSLLSCMKSGGVSLLGGGGGVNATFHYYAHFVKVHDNIKIEIFKMATNFDL